MTIGRSVCCDLYKPSTETNSRWQEMNPNLNPSKMTHEEELKKLLSLISNRPADPDNRRAVWYQSRTEGKKFWQFMLYVAVIVCPIAITMRYTEFGTYFSPEGAIFFLLGLCVFGFSLDHWLYPRIFYSSLKHEASLLLDNWNRDITTIINVP